MIRGAAAAACAGLGLGSGRAARRDPVSLRSKDMEYAATRTGDERESFRGRLRESVSRSVDNKRRIFAEQATRTSRRASEAASGSMGEWAGARVHARHCGLSQAGQADTSAGTRSRSAHPWTTAQHVNTLHTRARARARTRTHARTHARTRVSAGSASRGRHCQAVRGRHQRRHAFHPYGLPRSTSTPCIRARARARKRTHAHKHTHARTHACTHAQAHARTHASPPAPPSPRRRGG